MVNLRTRPQICSSIDRSVVRLCLLREEHVLPVVVLVRDDDGLLGRPVHDRLIRPHPGARFERHQLWVGIFTGDPFFG